MRFFPSLTKATQCATQVVRSPPQTKIKRLTNENIEEKATKKKPTASLAPNSVRERARSVPGCREIPIDNGDGDDDDTDDTKNKPPSIICFLTGIGTQNIARVNVYYQTGTIGTCRVLNGKVREIFRKQCSLDTMERILRSPPALTAIDENLVSMDDWDEHYEDDSLAPDVGDNHKHDNDPQCRIAKIKKQIEIADVGLAILVSESENLESHVKSMEEQLNGDNDGDDNEEEETVSDDEDAKEYAYALPDDSLQLVEDCLRQGSIACIATNGKGTILLSTNGDFAYTAGIPKDLRKSLKKRTKSMPPPVYVSLGANHRYYIEFEDGKAEWYGPEKLSECLHANADLEVCSVAFGSKWDAFIIVFSDGSWEYHGKGIPDGLVHKIVDERGRRSDLVCATLGPKGEWFVRAKNGRMWWGGLSDELDSIINDVLDASDASDGKPRALDFLDFGDSGSYFFSYD